ncbi:hypothetical protein PIB30_057652 [Stylosanthes scabra]|uniref:Uncharacterized protein n=1 Tax=Stylosanthes scabra TaxID=79078 RepID=A0ABU6YM57_9FABA|nr:hypothetical protein [Stylosanthes scabra]
MVVSYYRRILKSAGNFNGKCWREFKICDREYYRRIFCRKNPLPHLKPSSSLSLLSPLPPTKPSSPPPLPYRAIADESIDGGISHIWPLRCSSLTKLRSPPLSVFEARPHHRCVSAVTV